LDGCIPIRWQAARPEAAVDSRLSSVLSSLRLSDGLSAKASDGESNQANSSEEKQKNEHPISLIELTIAAQTCRAYPCSPEGKKETGHTGDKGNRCCALHFFIRTQVRADKTYIRRSVSAPYWRSEGVSGKTTPSLEPILCPERRNMESRV
jgi:hypothetical protein